MITDNEDDDDTDEDDEDDDEIPPESETVIHKWRWEDVEEPDEPTLRKMLALAYAEGVKTVFQNHTYTFNGKIYLQRDGGPIGLRLTAAVARLVCIWFDNKFLARCAALGISVMLYKRRLCCQAAPHHHLLRPQVEVPGQWSATRSSPAPTLRLTRLRY